jgi:hypothetical protein
MTLRDQIEQLKYDGVPTNDIIQILGRRFRRDKVRNCLGVKAPPRKPPPLKEPKPPKLLMRLAYVRPDGERMFEVYLGHIIGERSLQAFGFTIPQDDEIAA